jgi:hypothetical protein
MNGREKRTQERLNALIKVLVEDGVISDEWATAIQKAKEPGEAQKVAQAKREGRDPPNHANGGGGNS